MQSIKKWKYRHSAILVVFLVWCLSYMDRMVMATALPFIAKDLDLQPATMGVVLSAFFFGYALFQIPGGILADRFGPRKVLVVAIIWWSIFTAFTGAAWSLGIMIVIRVLFGIGEGCAPAATWKTLANWTPQRSRSIANGFMMSSNALGPALAPLFVVGIITAWGWREVFYALLIPGTLLAAWIWFSLPDNPADKKGITKEELAELDEREEPMAVTTSDDSRKLTFFQVFAIPAVYKSFFILLFSNMTFWGFSSWLPTYLVQARGLDLKTMGLAASLPFFAGTIGIILGGWLSDVPFKNNRKLPLIAMQWLSALFLYLTYTATSFQSLLIYQVLAGFFINASGIGIVFGLPMSAISKEITGRAMGIVNTAGQIAGFVSPIIIGYLVGISGGGARSFDMAFMFLIGSVLISSFCAMTFKQRPPEPQPVGSH